MGLGFDINATNLTEIKDNLDAVSTSTNFPDFMVNVNHYIYDGWLFVIVLFVTWIIFFMVAQKNEDDLLNNLLYSSAIVSVLSLLMRGIYVTVSDTVMIGLLTDSQLWIFPLITIVLSLFIYSNK